MEPQNSLIDSKGLIVADASAVINLNASKYAREILDALPNHIIVVNPVVAELEVGRHNGRDDAKYLQELVADGFIEIGDLNETATQLFEELVIGSAALTLDDGESATIAHAIEKQGIAIVDERKANRICRERFPKLHIGCSINLFAHPEVQKTLGKQKLIDAITNALRGARMRVPPDHLEWVVSIIGTNNVGLFNSLPRSIRLQ